MARNGVRVVLDPEGIKEVLRGPEVRAQLDAVAEEMVALIRARGLRTRDGRPLPVEIIAEDSTDRAAVTVAIPHPAGVGMEARHGVLRQAAQAAGLTVIGLDPHRKARTQSRKKRRKKRKR
ncbi:hypothetical protein [Kutzneria sp. NPDC051319]|uniref:hypothetical protein n=1 Tax=Kutzneria sp. NPDC051319 TaxID=3155047 RepID=UPI0034228D51